MSKRRSTILQVAREAGALWRMNGTAWGYLAEEAPRLYRVLEELSEITKEVPNAHPHGGMPLDSEGRRETAMLDGPSGEGTSSEGSRDTGPPGQENRQADRRLGA